MALLYPWATKEYLLNNMTIGQLLMYNNIGCDMKYGKTEDSSDRMKSAKQLIAEGKKDVLFDEIEQLKKDCGYK